MIGRIIGNYRVASELAQGGMGTVYRGHHVHLPREVVVKSVLLAAFSPAAQSHLKARFRREAYIQSQLDHPNIVRVYEFFALDDNYYLVMEYVPGMSLKDLLETQGAPTPAQVVYLCKQALAALNYAHNFSYVDESDSRHIGIIHRDIKPANLLLDAKGRLKVTDFGIVKAMGEEGLTQSGFQPGTVEYMSPEQLLGLDVDVRSDLYCLGVTFYEMLTGRLPFLRSATGSDWEVRKGHIERDPPEILEICPGIHPTLAAIFMRSLRKSPNERFQSAVEFMEALRSYEQQLQTQQTGSGKLTQPVFNAPTVIDQATTRPAIVIPARPVSLAPSQPPAPMYSGDESMTIPLGESRELSGLTDESPTIVAAGEMVIDELVKPSSREVYLSLPMNSPRRRWPAAVAGLIVLFAGAAAGAYLFSGKRQTVATVTLSPTPKIEATVAAPSPTATPVSAAKPKPANPATAAGPSGDPSALKQAQSLEKQQRYADAIQKYQDYLVRHPTAADAKLATDKLIELRQYDAMIRAANGAMQRRKFVAARNIFAEALKLRPESEAAQAGLAEAQSKMDSQPFRPPNNRPFRRPPNAPPEAVEAPPPGQPSPPRGVRNRRRQNPPPEN